MIFQSSYIQAIFISYIIGGGLSNPATRWPDTLGRIQFLQKHPYFLPCSVSGFIALATFIIAALTLKEVYRHTLFITLSNHSLDYV